MERTGGLPGTRGRRRGVLPLPHAARGAGQSQRPREAVGGAHLSPAIVPSAAGHAIGLAAGRAFGKTGCRNRLK
ncbi:hypothetical protein G6F22_021840 [Rhizopus arrhizus]|nr:hypothetical protein G6F22_021840 [Rhizopus arrhizus]